MAKTMLVILVLLTVIGCSPGDDDTPIVVEGPFDHTYRAYAGILSTHVVGDRVTYAKLKDDREVLDAFVASLETAELDEITRDDYMSFYINAYNAITLRSVIDAYPVESIQEIDGVWKDRIWIVAGERVTLDYIEHEILRKQFSEPRIHVAINCASISCPSLSPVPYRGSTLEKQLHAASEVFASDMDYNYIDFKENLVYISEIFKWFGDDFVEKYYDPGFRYGMSESENAAIHFILAHSPLFEHHDKVADKELRVQYIPYDWALNDAE